MFFFYIKIDLSIFSSVFAIAGRPGHYAEAVWATLVALAFLSCALSHLQDSWMLVASKAEKWLGAQQLADQAKATEEAQRFVKSKLNL